MTAVVNLPILQQNNRPRWSINGGQVVFDNLSTDEVARKFASRKSAPRSNSSPSLAPSGSLSSSTATLQSKFQVNGAQMTAGAESGLWATTRKKTPKPGQWPPSKGNAVSIFKVPSFRPFFSSVPNETNISSADMIPCNEKLPNTSAHHQSPITSHQSNRSRSPSQRTCDILPILCLIPMNGTFDRKTIAVPYFPERIRVGRQTNTKTIPTQFNGFFDSKVLSRQHAEIWADRDGKIWIKDVKSSNGTFVNGTRLSAENRDSDPHELETQDHLDLGIDIIGEDQKVIIHHKVSAKVEYAGYPGAAGNYSEVNLGEFDQGASTITSSSQGSMHMKAKMESHGSPGSNTRLGANPSFPASQMSANQQRQMNFWLTPVTMEQIVKRLTHEMRMARLQNNELGKAHEFLGSLLYSDCLQETDKLHMPGTAAQGAQVNNGIISNIKPQFLNPPAPPPQQPLPEKPDSVHIGDAHSQFNVNRKSNERSLPTAIFSSTRSENSDQIVRLVEALASANNEIEAQKVKLSDMEVVLKNEKQARERAEKFLKTVQLQLKLNPHSIEYLKNVSEGLVVDQTFKPCIEYYENSERTSESLDQITTKPQSDCSKHNSEYHLGAMCVRLKQMKMQLDIYKYRAKTAESERDAGQKTLDEMIEKIQCDKAVGLNLPTGNSTSYGGGQVVDCPNNDNAESHNSKTKISNAPEILPKFGADTFLVAEDEETVKTIIISKNNTSLSLYYHAAPIASMIVVVLIGVAIMSYLNGLKAIKLER